MAPALGRQMRYWYQQLPERPDNQKKPQDDALSQKRNYNQIEGFTESVLNKKSHLETKVDDGGVDVTSDKYGGEMELTFPLLDYWGAGSGGGQASAPGGVASGTPASAEGGAGGDGYEGRHPEATAINTDDNYIKMDDNQTGYKIDVSSLNYEMTVGRLMGKKRAFNSSEYGSLEPDVKPFVHIEKNQHRHRVKQTSNIDQGLAMAELPSGKRPHTSMAAKDFAEPVRVEGHPGREGALILNRGMNQFRNPTVKRKAMDMDYSDVKAVTPQSKEIVINGQPMEPQNRLQYKTPEGNEDQAQGGYMARQFFGNAGSVSQSAVNSQGRPLTMLNCHIHLCIILR